MEAPARIFSHRLGPLTSETGMTDQRLTLRTVVSEIENKFSGPCMLNLHGFIIH